jgi:hypothetical protein
VLSAAKIAAGTTMPPSAAATGRRPCGRRQFALQDLALDLESDDEEERGHQRVVDPVPERQVQVETSRSMVAYVCQKST